MPYKFGVDLLGTVECPVAPYFQALAEDIRPGHSLDAWERYWRLVNLSGWLAGAHGQRMAASRVRDTLEAIAPAPELPSPDVGAARASVSATVAAAMIQAADVGRLNNDTEIRRLAEAQQAFTSGG